MTTLDRLKPLAAHLRMKARFLRRTYAQTDASKGLWSFMTWLRKHRALGRDGSKRNRPALIRHLEKSKLAAFRARNKILFTKRRGCRPVRILFLPVLASFLGSMERPAKHLKPIGRRFRMAKQESFRAPS